MNATAVSAADYALPIGSAVVLVMLSGLFSGLNLGLLSFTDEDLRLIIESSDSATEIRHAKLIRPLRKRGNLLLCTLVLGCTLINAVVAVLLADLANGVVGTIITTASIVVFAEILPQSICSRHGLAVGAYSLPFVYTFLVICLPITWPLAWVLDRVLGRELSCVFTRKGLMALIRLNVESGEHAKHSGLTKDDGRLLGGALTYRDRCVGDVMTPLDAVFALPVDAVLDKATLLSILTEGHTRVPVYRKDKTDLVGILFAKDLIGIGFERTLALAEVIECFNGASRLRRAARTMKLDQALDACQRERVHMMVVTEDGGSGAAIGIATMEDFLEEILQVCCCRHEPAALRTQLSSQLSLRFTGSLLPTHYCGALGDRRRSSTSPMCTRTSPSQHRPPLRMSEGRSSRRPCGKIRRRAAW